MRCGIGASRADVLIGFYEVLSDTGVYCEWERGCEYVRDSRPHGRHFCRGLVWGFVPAAILSAVGFVEIPCPRVTGSTFSSFFFFRIPTSSVVAEPS